MSEPVSYTLEGQTAVIAMDDGKVNALSVSMLEALHGALDRAEQDGAVVVLTGREGVFSAGFDLNVFASGDSDRVLEMLTLGATLCERILSFSRPVVVACSGHAVAAGVFLALVADMRIGVEGPYQLGLNEVRIGLTVPWFAIEIASRRLHPAHYDRAVVNAVMYDPPEAVAAGFLDRVVAPSALAEQALHEAAALAELSPAAHAATKLRVRGGALKALRAAIASELTPAGMTAEKAMA
ncbi:MAG: crotonase/enoyl-CoA hydratase family protein [Solirubrobacteraceae bacterium]